MKLKCKPVSELIHGVDIFMMSTSDVWQELNARGIRCVYDYVYYGDLNQDATGIFSSYSGIVYSYKSGIWLGDPGLCVLRAFRMLRDDGMSANDATTLLTSTFSERAVIALVDELGREAAVDAIFSGAKANDKPQTDTTNTINTGDTR